MIKKDFDGIRNTLRQDPLLANEGIPLDEQNTAKAHPLHRICDGVFNHSYTDEEAIEMAKIFLAFGADIDGYKLIAGQDTPLIAAASLHAENAGIFYIEQGADIYYTGFHGGTALHLAAWVGRNLLVKRLLQQHAEIDKRCTAFRGTPLVWAVHGYKFGGEKNRHRQIECVRLLLEAGADKIIPNKEGTPPIGFLDEEDTELIQLLS